MVPWDATQLEMEEDEVEPEGRNVAYEWEESEENFWKKVHKKRWEEEE